MSKKIDLDVDLVRDYRNAVPIGVDADYPTISFTEDEPCDIPEEGTLTIKYRLVRHSEDTTNEEKPQYSYTIQVEQLVSAVGEDAPAVNAYKDEAGDALDALAAEKSKRKRVRNIEN